MSYRVPLMFALALVAALFGARTFAQDMPLSQVLIPGEEWELVSEGHKFTEGPAADAEGRVYFVDVPTSQLFRIELDGKVTLVTDKAQRTSGLMFGADGKLYGCQNGGKQIVAYDTDGTFEVLAKNVTCNDLCVDAKGGVYWTDPKNSRVRYRTPEGKIIDVATDLKPNGIILTGGGASLVVTDNNEPLLWTFRVLPDGTLDARAPYYAPLQMPTGQERPGSDGMTVDTDGRLYVATHAGVQMWDPTGRLGGTIAKPQDAFLSNVVFGGPDFRTLYATSAGRVYRRKVKPEGERLLRK